MRLAFLMLAAAMNAAVAGGMIRTNRATSCGL